MKISYILNDNKKRTATDMDIVKENKKTILIRIGYKRAKYRMVKGKSEKYRDTGTKTIKLHLVKNKVSYR